MPWPAWPCVLGSSCLTSAPATLTLTHAPAITSSSPPQALYSHRSLQSCFSSSLTEQWFICHSFPGKLTQRWRFMCTIYTGSTVLVSDACGGVKEAGLGRRRYLTAMQLQQRPQHVLKRALEVGWP